MKKPMDAKTKVKKMSIASKLVMKSFLTVAPKIIELWKSDNSDLTFDEWLLDVCQVKNK